MSDQAERCSSCGLEVRTGATFCTQCGSPLSNRGARIGRNLDQARQAAAGHAARQGPPDPGRISVAPVPLAPPGHARHPGPGEGTTMNTQLGLVPASAGKRLGAAVLDWLGPLVVLTIACVVGILGITESRSNGFIVYDTGLLALLGSVASGLTVVYMLVLLAIEARSGNTIGNRLMGIRSADADGYAPGGGAVFVRGILTGAGMVLCIIVTVVFMLIGWLGLLLWVLPPLLFLATVWAILVVLSSSWDRNGKLRGWHDKAAKSLVFDVTAGRNPVTSGGIQGPYSFAPLELPPVQQVSSPLPGASTRAPQVIPAQGVSSPKAAPAHVQPLPAGPGAAIVPPAAPAMVPAHADDDLERTRMRLGTERRQAVLRIRFDDGQDIQLAATALIGRNPAAHAGEATEQLLPVADPGRTISKTHLHLRVDGDGVWVTDRNSTNGSAVTTPDGNQVRLQPGQPLFVRPGSTVRFGDRTFHLGQA